MPLWMQMNCSEGYPRARKVRREPSETVMMRWARRVVVRCSAIWPGWVRR